MDKSLSEQVKILEESNKKALKEVENLERIKRWLFAILVDRRWIFWNRIKIIKKINNLWKVRLNVVKIEAFGIDEIIIEVE